jgi:hypothetical protein
MCAWQAEKDLKAAWGRADPGGEDEMRVEEDSASDW